MNVMLNCPSGCETIHHRLKCGAQIYIIPKNRNISVGAVVIGYGAADREFYYENKYYIIFSKSGFTDQAVEYSKLHKDTKLISFDEINRKIIS